MRARVLTIFGAALFASVPAWAEESNEPKAERLFKSGEKKFDAGHYAEACPDFDASLKLMPKLGTLLNVALCHEMTGRLATAWQEFHHAAAWAAQSGQRDRREFAIQHIVSLEPRLPRVALKLPVTIVISNVDLDGEPLAEQKWYLPLFLDAGEHVVAVSAPGKQRSTVRFRVTDATSEQLIVVPMLSDDPKVTANETKPTSTSPWLLVGIGAGALLIGVAAGYGIAQL